MKKTLILPLMILLFVGVVNAATINDKLHVNIQVTNDTGYAVTGTYAFVFNITNESDCTGVLYSNSTTQATDVRGIVSLDLPDINLSFDEQYYLCYYRNGTLKETIELTRSPYSYTTKNISAEGIMDDSNINLSTHNITADQFIGNGSLLTGITDTDTTYTADEDWINLVGTQFNFNDSKLSVTYYAPSSATAVAGTVNGGSIANVSHNDGGYDEITFNFTEVAGSPGLDLRMNFTGVTAFTGGLIRYETSSLSGDFPIIQLWDYADSDWEDYPQLADSNGAFTIIEASVFDDDDHISGGVVQMRLYKSANGNANNHYYVDWVAIYKGFGVPAGEEVDPYSIHKDGGVPLTGNWDQGAYNLTNTDSWFLGKVNYSSIQNHPADSDTTYTAGGTYIYLSTTTFWLNETALNATITALIATLETDTHVAGDGTYLYNDSTTMYLNETKLNATIAALDSGDEWSDLVDSDIIPDTDSTYDIGNSTHRFTDGYFDNVYGSGTSEFYWVGVGSILKMDVLAEFNRERLNIDFEVDGNGRDKLFFIDAGSNTIMPGGNIVMNNTGTAYNITYIDYISAFDWSNVSITESQISDLSHTVDTWNTTEQMQDAAGAMATNGDGVDFAYDDGANTLTPSFDCSDVAGTGLDCTGEDLILSLTPTVTTLDTGQGANELYDMDQNVLTTSNVTFNSVNITGNVTTVECIVFASGAKMGDCG